MKRFGLLAGVILVVLNAEASAQVVTGLTIDSVTVVQNGGLQQWTITAKGTVSLAAGDTLNSYTFSFLDPNKNPLAPTFSPPFVPPQPGNSSPYTCVLTTQTKGAWMFGASITYITGGMSGQIGKSKPFNVPGP